jgi:2-keto-3-deoxy-L-rhamnonate aldolase RhmA
MAACALDGGAQGILMPHVESVEEAQAAVEHLRFPPIGHRATLAGLPQYNYLPVDVQQVSREVNASTLIGLMIESPRGVENADAIAAIEGVDVLVIGINDLAQEMGLPGQLDHPKVVEACRKVVEATSRRGKFVGTGGIRDLALMHRYIDMGFQFILGGNDFAFMMTAASAHASAIRGES